MAAAETVELQSARSPAARPFISFLASLLRSPSGCLGLFIVGLLVVTAAAAPLIAPFDPLRMAAGPRLQPPSLSHLMGTDDFGRDVFSRIVYGARISVTVGFGAVTLSILLPTILGVTSGYFGGKVDVLVQRVVGAAMALPPLVILLSIMAVLGPGLHNVILVRGIVPSANRSMVIRGAHWWPRKTSLSRRR